MSHVKSHNICHAKDRQEKAIVLLMVDTGLRRSEVTALDWGDLDLHTGLTRIRRGKGGKARLVLLGANTRRALLTYRRQLEDTRDITASRNQLRASRSFSSPDRSVRQ